MQLEHEMESGASPPLPRVTGAIPSAYLASHMARSPATCEVHRLGVVRQCAGTKTKRGDVKDVDESHGGQSGGPPSSRDEQRQRV